MQQTSVAVADSLVAEYGEYNVVANADGLVYVFTEKEVAAEEQTYKLVVNSEDAQITSEYTASSVELAGQYFRDYVNNNGLGDLEWSYDPATYTFTATDGL